MFRCLELCCKTKVGEAGEDSNTKNMKVDSDSASESKIQESLPVAVVECNNSIDDSRSISEADDTLLSACEEHEGLSDAVGGFEPSSIKEGGEALEQVRSVQSNDNFKDANNLVQGECSIVDAANTLDESVCDVIMAIEEKLEAVEIKTCSDNSSRSSSYNRVTEVVDGHDFTTDEQGRSMDDAVDELNVKPDLSMNNEESRVCVSSTNMNVENIDDSVFTVEDVNETECSIHEGRSKKFYAVKPDWIADAEMTACMLCCAKFTFLLRRHHCRSCGRLLCSQCTSYRVLLLQMRTSVSKRLKDLRMEEEKVCFLPDSLDDCSLYYRTLNGTIHKYDDIATVLDTFNSGQSLIITITRNLWCEIKLCQCKYIIYGIYKSALKNQEINLHNKMGLREAHIRMPNFYLSDQSVKGEFMDKDILLFRPSVQCFENLLVPEKPFFVGCFLHRVESVWALSIPQRLLYFRILLLGYPTPVVNIRSRKPVYLNVTDTTVLRMFCDFKNWVYRLPLLHGSVISLCDNETRLLIPNFQKEEVKRLVNSNKSMFAWALSFNDLADSHLVCEQSDDAVYKTQVFTSGDSHLTGASFIVIDGALKGTDIPVNVNVVEVCYEIVNIFNCKVELPSTIFVIEWKEIESTGYCKLLKEYWISVFNCDDGKFPVALRSNVFAAAEQIAGQIPYTITPFVNSLTRRKLLYVFYIGFYAILLKKKLNFQLVPGLFNVCSYISVGFTAEMRFALISTCSLP
uniref:FYVE-type domain-containing protein n=1 Tax=Syphacia muris TaxID=451379 RepID=A0A0N5AV60_9BILA